MKKASGNRTRAYYRHHRQRVIRRKCKIVARFGWEVKAVGRFAKGKIHCSCRYCRAKTWEIGFPKSELVRRPPIEVCPMDDV